MMRRMRRLRSHDIKAHIRLAVGVWDDTLSLDWRLGCLVMIMITFIMKPGS